MSIARPTALIRRAVALPIGLLDRVEASLDAGLDAGFARVDGAVDRRISAVTYRLSSISQGLVRSSNSLDRALDRRVASFDSGSTARVAKTKVTVNRIGSIAASIGARTDAKLNRSLHTFDHATTACTRVAVATVHNGVALTHRADKKITRGFDRVDARAVNVINRAHSRRIKTANLSVRLTARIDKRIETDFLRADARVNAGINHAVNAIETTLTRAVATTNATDARISNAVTRVDARIDRRVQQSIALGTSTVSYVSTKAAQLERSIDTSISRVDARVSNGQAHVVAATAAGLGAVNAVDNGLTRALTNTDTRIDRRVQQLNRSYGYVSEVAINRLLATEAKLDNSVAAFDHRVATGVGGLMLAARNISHFVTDQVDDADTSLTRKLSQVDGRVDSLIDLINGQPGRHASQPRASLPWAATSLTMVLGTLGAATGASVVNANTVQIEIDSTVKIEVSAAKDAVTQYLSVRDSFQALQASRSRSIQSLEQEIAAAEARISQTGLSGKAIIDVANNYGGVPYVRGGTTPKGFDCSGYTKHVFAQLGVTLPRVSGQQYAWADKVSFDDRKVGDLMFWSNGGGVHHVAIYAGDGKMWDSPRPGRRVGKSTIWGNPTYGRVPVEAVNASARAEIAAKKAELKKIKANEPKLEITIHPNFVLPSSD